MTEDTWRDFMDSCSTTGSLVLVAPYIKLDALQMTLDAVGDGAEITCITRWTPLDVSLGASDVACRSLILNKGGSFRLHNSLHAKYYRADDRVLIGSANLTMSGLGFATSPNLEILTWAESFDGGAFERRLLHESREITDDEYAMWERMPKSSIDLPDIGFPILDLDQWKPQTRQPEYLWQVYSGRCLPSDDQYELAMSDLDALKIPATLTRDAFDDWVRSVMSFSPFVGFVLRTMRATRNEAELWDMVCAEWNIEDRSAASRLTETVENWAHRYSLLHNSDLLH